jgi:5'(3')-deoxyribonucleotidase
MHKVILLDQDGVFCDFLEGFYQLAAKQHPELIPHLPDRQTQQTFYIDECVADPAMAKLAEELCNHPKLFGMLPPIPGAIEGVKLLKKLANDKGIEVMICTAPHKENKNSYSAKAEWIEKHLGFDWLNHTLIVRDKTVCSGIILLDDKPNPLGSFVPTWEHVLMDRPYNKHILNKARFHSWSEEAVEMLVNHTVQRYETYMYHMNSRGFNIR